jgi:hypothetical protein
VAYLLNTVDFEDYSITPGHVPGGNIALKGAFDMPGRIGDVLHEWGDEDGCELYTDADELFFGGRDIIFEGHISGSRSAIYTNLKSLYSNIAAVSGLSVFSTPYGDFNVVPKSGSPKHYTGLSTVRLEFREPVPVLTGGSVPASGSSLYTIDSVPMTSFGLYAAEYDGVIGLPEMKTQLFTRIEAEGYQINKRKPHEVDFKGYLVADSLAQFKTNLSNLYALFTSAGERTFNLRNQVSIVGIPAEGFKVDRVLMAGFVIAEINMRITATSIT